MGALAGDAILPRQRKPFKNSTKRTCSYQELTQWIKCHTWDQKAIFFLTVSLIQTVQVFAFQHGPLPWTSIIFYAWVTEQWDLSSPCFTCSRSGCSWGFWQGWLYSLVLDQTSTWIGWFGMILRWMGAALLANLLRSLLFYDSISFV